MSVLPVRWRSSLRYLALGGLVLIAPRAIRAADERAPPPAVVVTEPSEPRFHTRAATSQWSIGEPTGEEQQMLELMNRARMDPDGEADRVLADFGSNRVKQAVDFFLSQRPAIEWTRAENAAAFRSYPAKPPLAFDKDLLDAARAHSEVMRQNDVQSHHVVGAELDLTGRVDAVGYEFRGLGESVGAFLDDMVYGHAGFSIDWGQPTQRFDPDSGQIVNCFPGGRPCLGHRSNLMGYDSGAEFQFVEAGVGVVADSNPNTQVGPRLVTIDFGRRLQAPHSFVTGVCYEDKDSDGFYDPGEGVAGIRIDLDVGDHFAISSASGGYAIPVFGSPGQVLVTATGAVVQTTTVTMDGDSAKADFIGSAEGPRPEPIRRDAAGAFAFSDAAVALSTITFPAAVPPASGLVGDVSVVVDIDHPERSEFTLTLISPAGTEIVLFDRGPGGADLAGTFGRTLATIGDLRSLVGETFAGDWKLRITDHVPGNAGTVLNWAVIVQPSWVRPVAASRSQLFVKKLKAKDVVAPAGDTLSFTGELDVAAATLDANLPAHFVLRTTDGLHTEFFRTAIPAAAIVANVNGTSRTQITLSAAGLDLPVLPVDVEVEVVLGGAIARQAVPFAKRSFTSTKARPLSEMFRVDTLATTRTGPPVRWKVTGRLRAPGTLLGTGTFEIVAGCVRQRGFMSDLSRSGKSRSYKAATGVRKFTLDTKTGVFSMTVDGGPECLGGGIAGAAIPFELRLGDDGFFGSTSIVPAGSSPSQTY